jgi:hypothetical protein
MPLESRAVNVSRRTSPEGSTLSDTPYTTSPSERSASPEPRSMPNDGPPASTTRSCGATGLPWIGLLPECAKPLPCAAAYCLSSTASSRAPRLLKVAR